MRSLQLINRYFNEGILTRTDRILAEFLPSYVRYKNSGKVKDVVKSLHKIEPELSQSSAITIPAYSGSNQIVKQIIDHLQVNLSEQIYSAILHGSLADGSEIGYSDFDGLIILKDSIFCNRKQITHTAYHLNCTFALMLRHDPLQHHGWMITTESALNDWPVDFFPPEIFPYCKSLSKQEISLPLRYRFDQGLSKQRFCTFSNSLNRRIRKNGLPLNGFSLKSLFSEFMLIPSLYLSAKLGHGCYKRESFDKIRNYFSDIEIRVMDEVSEIRNQWPVLNKRISFDNTIVYSPAVRRKQIRESALTMLPEITYAKGLDLRMVSMLDTMTKSLA